MRTNWDRGPAQFLPFLLGGAEGIMGENAYRLYKAILLTVFVVAVLIIGWAVRRERPLCPNRPGEAARGQRPCLAHGYPHGASPHQRIASAAERYGIYAAWPARGGWTLAADVGGGPRSIDSG